jgi:hypothetical protein
MKLKRAVIVVSTWMLSVAVAAAAQSIAEENPPQSSPDLTAVEKAIKEKLESSNSPDLTAVEKATKEKLESSGSNKHQARPEPRSPSKSKKKQPD